MPETCEKCGRKGTHTCSICHAVKYCSQDCQRAHWKVHKKMCKSGGGANEEKTVPGPLSLARAAHDKWLLCGSRFWQKLQRSRPMSAPVVGLQNQGNTCYLNAILQCIVHTPLLFWSFQELPLHCLEGEACRWLAELQQLLEEMSQAQERGRMALSSKMSELITVNKEFTQGQQADAHEAFMFIMERLLEACLAVGDGRHDTSVQDAARSSPAAKEILERNSLIGFLFGMDLGQAVRCRSCGACSRKSHAEYCVYLRAAMGLEEDCSARPSPGYGYSYDFPNYSHRRSSSLGPGGPGHRDIPETSLQELFEAYTRKEEIDGYKCEKCGSRLGCEQSSYIKNKPNILVVYISRQKDTNRYGKIKRVVEFPERFDLSPFVEAEQRVRGKLSYRLYGVVVHKDVNSSTFFGHYIAYVKTSLTWNMMDDASVSRVSWSTVQEQQADLLFYAADEVDPPPLHESCDQTNGKTTSADAPAPVTPAVAVADQFEVRRPFTASLASASMPAAAVDVAARSPSAEPGWPERERLLERQVEVPNGEHNQPVATQESSGFDEVALTKNDDKSGSGGGGLFDWDELDELEA